MESRRTHQVNESKPVDDKRKEYTGSEDQEGTQTRSLKWIKAGPSLSGLRDGTAVAKFGDCREVAMPTQIGVEGERSWSVAAKAALAHSMIAAAVIGSIVCIILWAYA